ncbi:uncharacterized protein EV154DRAFT_538048 [Mucor mucedo]|uniref:uncharacterized protein n=1 Tax=Mucor mucedo TaxID=29922 RepID=UPI00221F8AB3|nr:uncharacterized protein EV154DRAFT_538048 [Mucor mucedo]KAI7891155.1 hypothetical protein EV154DRAFT_538048 [Mucor mucedo]
MIFMNVKRGHRRVLQREIATVKGIPRDQPLVTNVMGTTYPPELIPTTLKMPINIPKPYNTNYESIPTGMTSPRSMNSGMGGTTTTTTTSMGNNNGGSGNSGSTSGGSSSPITSLRSRLGKPLDNNVNSIRNITNGTSDNQISSSISSNDDDDSIDTNESVPAKRKYRRHAKPDRNSPIKPPSAYIMFSNDARTELKNQNLSFAELAKIVGDQWKNLSHIEKQAYERMAMRAKDEYLASLEQYRQTANYKRYQEYLDDFKSKQDAANRLIGRARKRAKQKSPGSGSIADSSSNGNCNSSGSSGSGSADAYGDKESVIRRQKRSTSDQIIPTNNNTSTNGQDKPANQLRPIQNQQQSSDSGYTSQTYYNSNNSFSSNQQQPPQQQQQQQQQQWSDRSNQIMRGMLPVEFIQSSQPENNEEDDCTKRRSPRFNKSTMQT